MKNEIELFGLKTLNIYSNKIIKKKKKIRNFIIKVYLKKL